MKPREPQATGHQDMFRSRLKQILHMSHAKAVLADRIDWEFLSEKLGRLSRRSRRTAFTDAAGGYKLRLILTAR